MGSNWRIYSLGDLIDVKHGFAFKGEYMRDDIEHGPIVVAIGNFDYNGGFRFSETKLKRYTSDYPESFTLQAGDMLLAMTCQTSGGEILGIPGIIPNDGHVYLHNQRLGKIVIKEPKHVCLEYLYWLFLSQDFNQFIFQRATGTKILHTSPTKILEYQTHLPPLAEQKKIARQLWQLQNKTILNRQISQTLEQMAQALFKSWFVDFDPVVDNALDAGFFEQDLTFPDELLYRADARRAVRVQEGFKPLSAATRQLFPAAFELCDEPSLGLGGWVPKGWENIAIYSLAEFINGAAYKAFEPNLEQRGLPIIKIAELKAGITAQTAFSDREMPDKYRLSTGDILFSWSGNPDTSIDTFVWTYGDALLNQHIFKVTPPDDLGERSFVLIALKSLRKVFAETARNKQTTGLGHVTVADLKRLQIVKPEPNVLAAWDSLVSPYVNQSLSLTLQLQTLSNLRDTLRPKLISGELHLDDIEADIAEEGAT